jgi:hypothetical protein
MAPDAHTADAILSRLDLDDSYARFATRFAPSPAWQTETARAR